MTNLYNLQLQHVIPENLTRDEKVRHLAQSLDNVIQDVTRWADKLNYKLKLDELPVEIIDHLLWENHITWNEGLLLIETHEQKVELVRNAIELHRTKGTPFAIERVFSLLGLNAQLQEWFEYGSDPYHFKVVVRVNERGITPQLLKDLETLIHVYKNVRSALEVIDIILRLRCNVYCAVAPNYGESMRVLPALANPYIPGDVPIHHAIGSNYGEKLVILPEQKPSYITDKVPVHHAIGSNYGEKIRVYPYMPQAIEQHTQAHTAVASQYGEKLIIYPTNEGDKS